MKKNTILKIFGIFTLLIVFGVESGFAQLGKVHGQVIDKDGNAGVGVQVTLKRDGAPLSGCITRTDGKYEIAKVDPGTYVLEAFDGEKTAYYVVKLSPGETQPLQLDMSIAYENGDDGTPTWGTHTDGGTIYWQDREVFTVDPIDPWVINKEELGRRASTRGSIDDIAAGGGGVTQPDQGDPLNFRGGRSEANSTYVNGQKVRGSSTMPLAAIDQISVLNSGIPAEYGDATGGIVVVTTYNPGMKGYFGPRKPNVVRKEIRKKHKELIKKGGEGLYPCRQGSFTLVETQFSNMY